MNIDHPLLLLVDIQKGLDDTAYWGGHRNNPSAEQNMARLLTYWRDHDLPLIHVKHNSTTSVSPLRPGQVGNEFKEETQPRDGEQIIEKEVNSAFIGTDLQRQLDEAGVKKIVVVGLTTDHCISTTTRMAGNLGYDTVVVSDATATFDKVGYDGQRYTAEVIHDTTLASLHEEFAEVLATEDLLTRMRLSQ